MPCRIISCLVQLETIKNVFFLNFWVSNFLKYRRSSKFSLRQKVTNYSIQSNKSLRNAFLFLAKSKSEAFLLHLIGVKNVSFRPNDIILKHFALTVFDKIKKRTRRTLKNQW